MQHLVEDHSVVDPTYIEDFLLTYRTFLRSPLILGQRLLDWFNDPSLRDKVMWLNQPFLKKLTLSFSWTVLTVLPLSSNQVTRVVLLWVNNHFSDFEGDPDMTSFLEEFQSNLEKEV